MSAREAFPIKGANVLKFVFSGVLCKIAIENHQAAVLEIADVLCGLVEETSPSKGKLVTCLFVVVSY